MSTTDEYERLDEHEVEAVRAYRRRLWTELGTRDPEAARGQITNALSHHADAWVDGIHLASIASVAFHATTVGDLTTNGKYALIALLKDGQA